MKFLQTFIRGFTKIWGDLWIILSLILIQQTQGSRMTPETHFADSFLLLNININNIKY